MAPFDGFSEDDFDYFVRPADDYGPILKSKLKRLLDEVHVRLPEGFRSRYPYVYSARLTNSSGERGIWAAFRPPQEPGDVFRHCNVTIELDSEGLSINAVIRDGRPSQAWTPLGRFALGMENDPAIVRALRLGRQFQLRVSERLGPNGGRILPGSEEWFLRGSLRLDHSEEDIRAFLGIMLAAVPFPGIHVRRQFPRWDATLPDGPILVAEATRTVEALAPVLEVLDGPSRG